MISSGCSDVTETNAVSLWYSYHATDVKSEGEGEGEGERMDKKKKKKMSACLCSGSYLRQLFVALEGL